MNNGLIKDFISALERNIAHGNTDSFLTVLTACINKSKDEPYNIFGPSLVTPDPRPKYYVLGSNDRIDMYPWLQDVQRIFKSNNVFDTVSVLLIMLGSKNNKIYPDSLERTFANSESYDLRSVRDHMSHWRKVMVPDLVGPLAKHVSYSGKIKVYKFNCIEAVLYCMYTDLQGPKLVRLFDKVGGNCPARREFVRRIIGNYVDPDMICKLRKMYFAKLVAKNPGVLALYGDCLYTTEQFVPTFTLGYGALALVHTRTYEDHTLFSSWWEGQLYCHVLHTWRARSTFKGTVIVSTNSVSFIFDGTFTPREFRSKELETAFEISNKLIELPLNYFEYTELYANLIKLRYIISKNRPLRKRLHTCLRLLPGKKWQHLFAAGESIKHNVPIGNDIWNGADKSRKDYAKRLPPTVTS